MIANMLCNKKRNTIVAELFTRGRKLNISLDFYNTVSKNIKLNSTDYFFMTITIKTEL